MDFDGLDDFVKTGMSDSEVKENCDYFENHPLFMQEVPENIQDNELMMAMQNIVYDDTPENNAKNLNAKANDILKTHLNDKDNDYWLKTAIKIYDDGLSQECKDDDLNSRMYSNRALIHMRRKNYGKVIDDCQMAVKLNPNFLRAYFRMSQAQLLVSKYGPALENINKCYSLDSANKEVQKLKQEIEEQIGKEMDKLKKTQEEERMKNGGINEVCLSHGVKLINKTTEVPGAQQVDMEVLEDNHFSTPILVFYPQFQNSDFIQRTIETDLLSTHLKSLLPLPWDTDQHYLPQNLIVFLEINKKGQNLYKRIDPNASILSALKTKHYKAPMMLQIYVLSYQSPYFKIFLENSQVEK